MGSTQMSHVIQSKIMKDDCIPILLRKNWFDMPCHIQIHFNCILFSPNQCIASMYAVTDTY